jgi:hypothetical protein
MPTNPSNPLDQAFQNIKNGDYQAAQIGLAAYLHANPQSDEAWYLLSLCMETEERQIECIQRAVALNPNNIQAKNHLERLLSLRNTERSPNRFEIQDEIRAPHKEEKRLPPSHFNKQPDYQTWEPLDPQPASQKRSSFFAGIRFLPTIRFGNKPSTTDPNQMIPNWLIWGVIGLSLLTILVCLVGGIALFKNRAEAARLALEATKNYFPTLPPTWTPTPPQPATATPPPTATRIPPPTPTLPAPPETALTQMDQIQRQVAYLRRLKIEMEVPRFLIADQTARQILMDSLLTDAGRIQLHDLERTLSTIGFIKPTYDLGNYALNASVDAAGGFFDPSNKNIYVLGAQFGALQRYVYAHEFDHALVDQHFPFADMGVYPNCSLDSDQCRARHALVEGDATLLMDQWLRQNAGPADLRDLANYRQPSQAFPEDLTPPAITQDLLFPYIEGKAFVEHLYKNGKWSAVDQAYAAPPETTEQILHPEKYDTHEPAVVVAPAALDQQLGTDWQQIASDSFGEWNTYLLLAYGADSEARLEPEAAQKAAAGWGGDHYQVYLQTQTNRTALAFEWAWDSPQDADEFMQAMVDHLDARFHGNQVDLGSGKCWQSNDQAACLYQAGSATLWLLAPDAQTIDRMRAGFPTFQ